MKKIYFLPIILAVLAAAYFYVSGRPENVPVTSATPLQSVQPTQAAMSGEFDFSKVGSIYRFSAKIPNGLTAKFVPAVEAISISDQIFIRYFQANYFLTLNTVNILSRREADINGHQAVWYEIEKKQSVPNFPNQPLWRSQRHKLVDIRMTSNDPSIFYVFAYNPDFSEKEFNKFIESLVFHNDSKSFREPLPDSDDRITKKPFGILVSPDSSPVQPEKFSGYHTGSDFEAFEGELNSDVQVSAICGGNLKSKASAQGYGGYAVQECILKDQVISVVYGHLDLSSIPQAGTYLSPGQELGVLGEGFSPETDNERKHLHLSILKGNSSDIRGYVQNQSELSKWLNPEDMLNLD